MLPASTVSRLITPGLLLVSALTPLSPDFDARQVPPPTPAGSASEAAGEPGIEGRAVGSFVELDGYDRDLSISDSALGFPAAAPLEIQQERVSRRDCGWLENVDAVLDDWCVGPSYIDLYEIWCPTGNAFTWPHKIRTRPAGTTTWGPWRLLNGACAPREQPTADPLTDIASELNRQIATLTIPPKPARIDPVTDWFAVQLPMTLHTDNNPETLTTTVLGTDVDLELTPTTFTWDPGDGTTPITTTRPGAPYPDQSTTHTYTTVGTYAVTLTATWTGRFRLTGTTTWHPITGTGTTTHTAPPIQTRELRSELVAPRP